MIRRASLILAILSLVGLAVWAGAQAPAHQAIAQDLVIDPAVEAKSDFQQLVNTVTPDIESSLAGIQSVNGSSTTPFPHPFLYGGPNSSGWPMVGDLSDQRPGPTAPLNDAVIGAYGRFPLVVLPTTPLADSRTDIIPALRAKNPSIQVQAYVMGHTIWCPEDGSGNIAYAPGIYYRDYYLAVTGGDPSCASTSNGFLWMQDGIKADLPPHNLGMNVNLAHRVQNPDSSYTYDVAEHLAEAMYEYGRPGRNWDGIFIDVFCPAIMWIESPGHLYDYARAGYGADNSNPANRTAFDLGWQAGHQRVATRLRELAVADGHPGYPISGNCAQAPERLHTPLNGWMRENYPFQNGGTFYSNLLTWPWGQLHQDRNFRQPAYNYIFSAASWSGGLTNNPGDEQYNASNQKQMRFGLASAALSNGWAAFHHGSGNTVLGHWFNWWYDEYGVNTRVPQSDPDWGKAMNGAAYSGWLGLATSPAYHQLSSAYVSTADQLTSNQGFESVGGSPTALPNWTAPTFFSTVATYERTTATSATGNASAHVSVTAIENPSVFWSTYMANGNFSVSANTTYSVSFKAKASGPLPVTVGIGNVIQSIPIDDQWRQYQAVLTPTNTVANGTVGFNFGLATGDYWIDDVHVQVGSMSVWRRDFEKGIVLVNPTPSTVTIDLEEPYRKILGTVDPVLNDGSVVTSVSIGGTNTGGGIGEAIFLLRLDSTPPGSVTDLSAP